jgi:protein TonB
VGGVEDVKVIEAEPKRIFNREAIRALRKWKYRPKMVDGKPQKQFGLTVQLDFTLNQD